MAPIYMDYNATTPVDPVVRAAMLPTLETNWGNASSIHWAGRAASALVDDARDALARLIGAPARDLMFTSGGTEGDNAAVLGILWALRARGSHVIISTIEHKAILDVAKAAEKLHGGTVTRLPVDSQGRVDPDGVRRAIREDTVLVSVMLANNEIGNINPVAEIATICHERDVLLHTDAVNALGKIPVDVQQLGVDLMSLSAHKIHGPKGVGALYLRKGTPFEAFVRGGGQERGRRCGTYNTPGIVGFGAAAVLAGRSLEDGTPERIQGLRDRLGRGLLANLPGVERNGDPEQALPNTLNLSFDEVDGEALVMSLDLRGIAISTGSACTSGSLEPSHVLLALGKDRRWLDAAIRFSLGRDNDEDQVDAVIDAVTTEVRRLRNLRPT